MTTHSRLDTSGILLFIEAQDGDGRDGHECCSQGEVGPAGQTHQTRHTDRIRRYVCLFVKVLISVQS